MSIQSHAFGRTILSGADADKFHRQVQYGRPKDAAVKAVQRGTVLARELRTEGIARPKLNLVKII